LVAALDPTAKQNDPVQVFIALQWGFLISLWKMDFQTLFRRNKYLDHKLAGSLF